MSKVMRIGELITELQKCPASGDVTVRRQIVGTGGDYAYDVVGIKGTDSGVVLEIPTNAYREKSKIG